MNRRQRWKNRRHMQDCGEAWSSYLLIGSGDPGHHQERDKAKCPRAPLPGGPGRLLSTYVLDLEMKEKERHQSLCRLIPSPEEVELGIPMLFQRLSANHSAHCAFQISRLRSWITWVISSLVGMKMPCLSLFLTLAVCGASCAS